MDPVAARLDGPDRNRVGFTGVEQLENDVLAGDDARLLVRRLSDYVTGRKVAGGSVLLTLDPGAQKAAYGGLAGKGRAHARGPCPRRCPPGP